MPCGKVGSYNQEHVFFYVLKPHHYKKNHSETFRKMLESTNSSKVARLVDSLDNYDDYQYDYDTLHFGVGKIGD